MDIEQAEGNFSLSRKGWSMSERGLDTAIPPPLVDSEQERLYTGRKVWQASKQKRRL